MMWADNTGGICSISTCKFVPSADCPGIRTDNMGWVPHQFDLPGSVRIDKSEPSPPDLSILRKRSGESCLIHIQQIEISSEGGTGRDKLSKAPSKREFPVFCFC